ncbi:recombinase family protein [Sphingosinithalassobacter portus]|uniref:recombinase family protein n=1 Tax=Stakelama portus TaxID=2676234 RepID=UPI000D6DEA76|nr:recombinase family protein [Sphingosinithalassobacter portus]
MTARTEQQAIIYARVSSKRQVADGNGLESQETACREYAERKGYEVVAVFRDDMTGKSNQRGGLKAMIATIAKRRPGTIVLT